MRRAKDCTVPPIGVDYAPLALVVGALSLLPASKRDMPWTIEYQKFDTLGPGRH